MQPWQWLLFVVALTVAGVAIWVLLELRAALREARQFLQESGAKLNHTLDESAVAIGRLNRASEAVEQGAERVRQLAADLGEFGSTVRRATRIAGRAGVAAAALVPAALSAWKLLARDDDEDDAPAREQTAGERSRT